ncbi:MAG: class II aldolase/adducin family protein [Anaerolineae bacterium]
MMDDWQRAAEAFSAAARRLWARGLVAGSGGNLSLRLAGGKQFMIKPSGEASVDCTAGTLLGVDLAGRVVRGEGRPSKDLSLHLGIYRARPEVHGLVHAHAPWCTALGLLDYGEMPLPTPHARDYLGRVPVVAYRPPGSPELVAAVTEAFAAGARAALLAEHGLVTAGPSLTKAVQLAELVEETAQVVMLARMAGAGQVC